MQKENSLIRLLITTLCIFLLLFLFVDFIVYSPNDKYGFGHWSFNIIWDFIYLRIAGPFLYGNHVSVGLGILAIPAYFLYREKNLRNIGIWTICAFSMVFIHELTLQIASTLAYGYNAIVYQTFSFYMLILFISFCLSLKYGNNFQKRKIYQIGIVTTILNFSSMIIYRIFNYHPYTLNQFNAGAQVYSLIPNLVELFLWFSIIIIWFIPRRIKDMHLQNYFRYLLIYKWKKFPLELDAYSKMNFCKEYKLWEKDYLPRDGLKGKTVLDIGSASGDTAYFFFQNGAKKVICIDPNPNRFSILKRNAARFNWNVELYNKYFELEDMFRDYDFAKIDCEGGEEILLKLEELPKKEMVIEIHSKELAKKFKKFDLYIEKRFILYNTWIAKTKTYI